MADQAGNQQQAAGRGPTPVLPDPAVVINWIGASDLRGGLNGFFTIYPGKRPAWHRVVLPAVTRVIRRLTGQPASGRRGWLVTCEGIERDEAQRMVAVECQREHDRRFVWLLWDDAAGTFTDIFSGEVFADLLPKRDAAKRVLRSPQRWPILAALGAPDLARPLPLPTGAFAAEFWMGKTRLRPESCPDGLVIVAPEMPARAYRREVLPALWAALGELLGEPAQVARRWLAIAAPFTADQCRQSYAVAAAKPAAERRLWLLWTGDHLVDMFTGRDYPGAAAG